MSETTPEQGTPEWTSLSDDLTAYRKSRSRTRRNLLITGIVFLIVLVGLIIYLKQDKYPGSTYRVQGDTTEYGYTDLENLKKEVEEKSGQPVDSLLDMLYLHTLLNYAKEQGYDTTDYMLGVEEDSPKGSIGYLQSLSGYAYDQYIKEKIPVSKKELEYAQRQKLKTYTGVHYVPNYTYLSGLTEDEETNYVNEVSAYLKTFTGEDYLNLYHRIESYDPEKGSLTLVSFNEYEDFLGYAKKISEEGYKKGDLITTTDNDMLDLLFINNEVDINDETYEYYIRKEKEQQTYLTLYDFVLELEKDGLVKIGTELKEKLSSKQPTEEK